MDGRLHSVWCRRWAIVQGGRTSYADACAPFDGAWLNAPGKAGGGSQASCKGEANGEKAGSYKGSSHNHVSAAHCGRRRLYRFIDEVGTRRCASKGVWTAVPGGTISHVHPIRCADICHRTKRQANWILFVSDEL